MTIGKYQTQIIKALWQRITRPKDLNGAFWWPTDGWITDPKEVERLMRERGLEL